MAGELRKGAVIVVDVQGDFTTFKKGSLAVDGTDEVYVRRVEQETKRLRTAGFPIFATQDWHPQDHVSFFSNHPGKKPFDVIRLRDKDQVLWPPHCVQGTPGAEILIDRSLFTKVIRKGMDPEYDSYSGFQDDGGQKTELDDLLRAHGIETLVVYGIATDYCVRATVLDGLTLGYGVTLIKNLCRGVSPGTSQEALEEMKSKGTIVLDELEMEKIGIP